MRRRIQLALCVALCGAWSGAHGGPSPTTVKGIDALKLVVGNTIRLKVPRSKDTFIYIDKDGTVQTLRAGRREEGAKWTFTNGKLCYVNQFGRADCGLIEITGSSGTLTMDGGQTIPFRIERGNTSVQPAAPGSAP